MLAVTNQEQKIQEKDDELKKVKEAYDKQKSDAEEIEKKYVQTIAEKNILSEQLQAEAELCAEAEEVRLKKQEIRSMTHILEQGSIYEKPSGHQTTLSWLRDLFVKLNLKLWWAT